MDSFPLSLLTVLEYSPLRLHLMDGQAKRAPPESSTVELLVFIGLGDYNTNVKLLEADRSFEGIVVLSRTGFVCSCRRVSTLDKSETA